MAKPTPDWAQFATNTGASRWASTAHDGPGFVIDGRIELAIRAYNDPSSSFYAQVNVSGSNPYAGIGSCGNWTQGVSLWWNKGTAGAGNGPWSNRNNRIAVHELGHVLGLNHFARSGTSCDGFKEGIMNTAEMLTCSNFNGPQADDVAGVNALYS